MNINDTATFLYAITAIRETNEQLFVEDLSIQTRRLKDKALTLCDQIIENVRASGDLTDLLVLLGGLTSVCELLEAEGFVMNVKL